PAHRAHAPAVVKSEKENRKKTKEIPCKDPTRRREYDKAYKQKQRATGLTKKGIDTRLTAIEIETAEDVRDLSHEVVAEVRNADSSSFELEPKLRIKLQAVEIALRLIEISRFPRLSRNRLRRAHLRSEKQVLMPGSSSIISEPFFAHPTFAPDPTSSRSRQRIPFYSFRAHLLGIWH
ncbi:MAG: hypothetical protein WBZ42_08060, partial [Halobacteriota archaeon]